jgi:hypothetical protein
MRPRRALALLATAALVGIACSRSGDAPLVPASDAPKLAPGEKPLGELSVVYAGDDGGPRTASFRVFLKQHCGSVRVVDVQDLANVDLAGADVLIVDGTPLRGHGRDVKLLPGPKGVTLDTLAIPTVLIGGLGGQVSDSLELKLGWKHG